MGYTHGIRWNDEVIKEKVLEIVSALHLNRMPSRSECNDYCEDTSLTNAISKRIGWYRLAKELGLPIKASETQTGKTAEAIAMETLVAQGFAVERMPQNFPYDLLVDGCVKVDVKASHLYRGKNGDFYCYGLAKPFATCDAYILITLDDGANAEKFMVVPSKFVVKNKQISVGSSRSKYDKYTDRWDYIKTMVDFWNEKVV